MHRAAFLLALIAVVLFLADYLRSKSFITLGLAAVTVAWMVQVIWTTGSHLVVD